MIVIVDYGMGNIRSVEKALKRLGTDVVLSSDPSTIANAKKIILPGVGHFEKGMSNLKERNLIESLTAARNANVPMLGICLGMQLLTNKSEEATCNGLGFIDVDTVEFSITGKLKIPHMGWNTFDVKQEIPLIEGLDSTDSFYFAHSFHVDPKNAEKSTFGTTDYGYTFPSMIMNGSVMGVQFHPEKSHDSGLKLLNNFIENY